MKTLKLSSTRHVRLFTTTNTTNTATATTTTTATSSSAISISAARARLRSEHDPDKALAIYSSVSDHDSSPVSSRYALDLTVNLLAKSCRFGDIEALIESHKKRPKITQEPYLSTLIRSYGRAEMLDHAIRTFNQMDELGTPRSSISFNALLSACNQSKKFDQVPKLFSEISEKYNISPDKISYGILIKSFCESDSPESAFPILKEMEEKNVEITAITYTTILDAFYKKGKIDEGEKIWKEMIEKGCSPDVPAYNVRISQAYQGKPEDVLALIDEMSSEGLKPNTISYNYLLTSYCKNGLMEDAKKVYEGLEGNGCHPNASTFRTFIYHLCKNGDFDKGFEVFKESVKRDKVPDFGTMQHLVEGLFKESKLNEAKELIKIVKKKFPPSLNAWNKLEIDLGLNVKKASAAKETASGPDGWVGEQGFHGAGIPRIVWIDGMPSSFFPWHTRALQPHPNFRAREFGGPDSNDIDLNATPHHPPFDIDLTVAAPHNLDFDLNTPIQQDDQYHILGDYIFVLYDYYN